MKLPLKLFKSKKSFLWNEEDTWLIVGTETKKVHAKYRSKGTARINKTHFEKVYLEKCEIVESVTPKLNNRKSVTTGKK